MSQRAHTRPGEATSEQTTGGRVAKLSIAAQSACYRVYTPTPSTPGIVNTLGGIAA